MGRFYQKWESMPAITEDLGYTFRLMMCEDRYQLMNPFRPYMADTAVTEPDLAQEQAADAEEALEKLWKIIAHDDPFTTMEFVVRIMVQIFKKPLILAEAIMWQVHNEGLSVVETLPKPEAEYRVRKATAAARLEGFPFRFTIEPEE
jgi:ATP-dependent Clp protease adaptor protein ClpS